MDFRVDVYIHTVTEEIIGRLDDLKTLIAVQGATAMADFEALKAEVTKVTATEQAAIALIQGLSQQLKDAQAANDPAAIQAVIDQLDAQTGALAQAVAANTPSA